MTHRPPTEESPPKKCRSRTRSCFQRDRRRGGGGAQAGERKVSSRWHINNNYISRYTKGVTTRLHPGVFAWEEERKKNTFGFISQIYSITGSFILNVECFHLLGCVHIYSKRKEIPICCYDYLSRDASEHVLQTFCIFIFVMPVRYNTVSTDHSQNSKIKN